MCSMNVNSGPVFLCAAICPREHSRLSKMIVKITFRVKVEAAVKCFGLTSVRIDIKAF